MKTIVLAPKTTTPTTTENNNRLLAREVAKEGFVLLKNNGILPLTGKKIALYGSGARKTVKGGTGSGEVRNRNNISVEEGFINYGFEITSKQWLDNFDKFFDDTYEEYRQEMEKKVEGIKDFHKILGTVTPFEHPSGMRILESDIKEDCPCIYVIARQAGEGHDRDNRPGDFTLTDIEKENLSFLSKHYKELIVVVNAGGLIDLSFMDELDIAALVFMGQGGEEGGNALASLMSGETNFSGKLTDTWPICYEDVPNANQYSGYAEDIINQDYIEDIYVGYRYYERFKVEPRYHFGYGMSYSDFEIRGEEVSVSSNKVSLKVGVKNIGQVSGKEVVQLYAYMPFDDCEVKRLIGFKKSKLLKPNEEETVELSFDFKALSVYDEKKAAFVLRKGKYALCVGNSSNNTKMFKALENSTDWIIEQCENVCPLNREFEILKPESKIAEDIELDTILIDSYLEPTVINTYEEVNVEVDEIIKKMPDEDLANMVVGAGTSNNNLQVTALGASGSTSEKLYEKYGIPNVILSDGPTGLNLSSHLVVLPDGSVKAARVKETLEAYKRYLFGFSGMILKSQMAKVEDGEPRYQFTTAWPCPLVMAQTFNEEIVEKVGDGTGEEMEILGVTVWLAPGMNIHRSPLCGRSFEYYSEDPYVSGRIATAMSKGVQKHKGKYVSVKHFAANNCELQRNFSSSNVSERALREIYLKGFEMVVKNANPGTVMAAYNKINGVYCTNNYDLLTKVLRNEWKYQNLVMSDWDAMKANREDPTIPLSGDVRKAHHAQCDLICPGRADQISTLLSGLKLGAVDRKDLERSATRILKLIKNNTILEVKQ